MKIEYKIRGIVLTAGEMCEINEYYEQACTAEYLLDNYDLSEKQAMQLAADVRREMNKYGFTECDAIEEVFCRLQKRPKAKVWEG